jgi:hypothetical protein
MKVRTILSLAAAALAMAGSVAVLNAPLDHASAAGDRDDSGGVVVIVEDGALIPVTDEVRKAWDCPDYASYS